MRLFVMLLVGFMLPHTAGAEVINVPADAPTIQGGLDLAAPGDMVVVACGTYFEHDIVMVSGVHLRGETGDPDCVIIDAAGLGRVLDCDNLNGGTHIEGLTLTGGEVDGYGAGINCSASSLMVSSCVITGNHAAGAAGIRVDHSEVIITDCTISENVAGSGGGGMMVSSSSPLIDGCRFLSNRGMDGGGIFNRSGSAPEIVNTLFVNNEAQFWGGAYASDGHDTAAIIRNCTFAYNTAGWSGGGIWVANDTLLVENSIVAFSEEGGGICNDTAAGGYPSMVFVSCSNVFANEEGNYFCDLEDQTGIDGNISSHPLFCDQAGGDFHLAPGSPCLPAGNDCGVLMGAFGLGCDSPTAIADETAVTQAALLLRQNSPNPFNPTTEIGFLIREAAAVSLTVYNLMGRRVRTLIADEDYPAGGHRVRWDGLDDQGRALASGIYLTRIQSENERQAIRMVLIR